ncbi:hypothetical protein HK104_001970 [Borealophlyctis nickersoniae]|nr:hypothetical protein HK104_001970 [Borealophlyctis nickersoniae]
MSSQPHGISPAGDKTPNPSTHNNNNNNNNGDAVGPDLAHTYTQSEKHYGSTQKYQTEEEAWADPDHNVLKKREPWVAGQERCAGGAKETETVPPPAAGSSGGSTNVSSEKHYGTTQKYRTEEDAKAGKEVGK